MKLLRELLEQQNVIRIWFSPALIRAGWAESLLQGPYGQPGKQVVWGKDGKYFADASWWRGHVLPHLQKIWGPKGAEYGVDYGDETNERR